VNENKYVNNQYKMGIVGNIQHNLVIRVLPIDSTANSRNNNS